MLVDGGCEEVAERLTNLVDFPGVVVSPDDLWMPYGKPVMRNGSWDTSPAKETMLHESNRLVNPNVQDTLRDW